MATRQNKLPLTEAAIAALPVGDDKDPPIPPGASRIYRFEGGTGLAVRVFGSGKKTFLYCYTSDDLDARGMRVERRVALGIEWSKGAGTLALAKDKARKVGGKPPETKRAKVARLRAEQQKAATEITFDELAERYVTQHAKQNKRSWKEDVNRYKNRVKPFWDSRKVKDITRADVVALVTPVALGNEELGVPPRRAEANHVLALVRKMFSFAVDKGVIQHHPCLRMAAPGGKIGKRTRALKTAKELRLLWRITDRNSPWTKAKPIGWPRRKDLRWEARGRMSRTIADALRLVLATGCRANEAAALPWRELDLDEATWLLPEERSKNGLPVLIPLLPEVVTMLRARRAEAPGEFVFPGKRAGTRHINDKHMSEALGYACVRLKRIGLEPFVTHDLRRTVKTGMAAAKVPKEVRDRVQNHKDPSVGEDYNLHDYLDEKRDALEKWARRLEGMLRPERDNVVQLRRGTP